MSSIWNLMLEKICPQCGGGFSDANPQKRRYCSRECAAAAREWSDESRSKSSAATKAQWDVDRAGMLLRLFHRDMSNASARAKALWRDPAFRKRIQAARASAGYPDKNRPEAVGRRKARAAVKNSLSRCLRIAGEKRGRTFAVLGYTPDDLRRHLESLFAPGMSWENYGEWEIDHKYPISAFPLGTGIDVINALANLQPLWKIDNRRKRARVVQISPSL